MESSGTKNAKNVKIHLAMGIFNEKGLASILCKSFFYKW
jgi:hypothetical protein